MANVCGGIALDANALNYFFAAEALVAVLLVAAGVCQKVASKTVTAQELSAD
jgi:hypothetical protein